MKKKIIIAVSAFIIILAAGLAAGGILSVNNKNKLKGFGSDLIPQTASGTPVYGQELKIGTYNINFVSLDEDLQKIVKDISHYNLDVVCFQEVEYSKDNFVLEKLSKLTGLENYRFFATDKKNGVAEGIGIISKYAFEDANSLKLTASSENKSNNILSYVKIRFNGIPLKIFTTQLSRESATLRLAQFKDINRTISAETDGYILTGDFSVQSFDEFSALTDVRFMSHKDIPYATFYSENPNDFYGLDNIIIPKSMEFKTTQVYNRNVSDHMMIVSTVTVNEKM